jgi:methylthioribose-1-phosphate isomerase
MNVTLRGKRQHHRTVSFDALSNSVVLIEQRLLPHEFRLVKTRDYRETAEAITTMVVRGA